MTFLIELLFLLSVLIGLGFIGGFAVIPFSKDIRYAAFLSPIAGLFILVTGVASFYSVLTLSVLHSFIGVSLFCIIFTCISLVKSRKALLFPDVKLIFWILLVCAGVTYASNYTTIMLGHPGFYYVHGSDHLGYAHLADWLKTHLGSQSVGLDTQVPYESWPQFMFRFDPRFGSFFTLAIIAVLRDMSGMFSYDSACAIVLVIGYMGVAAIYARTPRTFILLLLGLLTSAWFDYSRMGFFGKILSYPGILCLVGWFLFAAKKTFTPLQIGLLALFTCGLSIMHSGIVVALFLALIGGIYLLLQGREKGLTEQWVVLLLLIGIAIAATGILSRPLVHNALLQSSWRDLLPFLFDLDGLGKGVRFIAFWIILVINAGFLLLAIIQRNFQALSLMAGSFLLLLGLMIAGAHWQASQLIGIFYPISLCAGVLLLDDATKEKRSFLLISWMLGISIALHVPNILRPIKNYASFKVKPTFQFSKVELDALANQIGAQPVIVRDITDPHLAIPILVELGRRNLKLQWTPASWKTILAYRPWEIPPVDYSIPLYLQTLDTPFSSDSCVIKLKTAQYQLLYCKV